MPHANYRVSIDGDGRCKSETVMTDNCIEELR
jgi:hypothetical protein